MSEPFLAEIIMFGGNFAPRGWAFCDGQLLPISQYTALFSLLGTTYGGDGRTTFALPDMRGRAPIHAGTGPGLTPRKLGSRSGQEVHTLTVLEMPSHNHAAALNNAAATVQIPAQDSAGDQANPGGNILAGSKDDGRGSVDTPYTASANADSNLAPFAASVAGSVTVGLTGGGQWHNNMQPYLTVNFIIALQGVFPSRN